MSPFTDNPLSTPAFVCQKIKISWHMQRKLTEILFRTNKPVVKCIKSIFVAIEFVEEF